MGAIPALRRGQCQFEVAVPSAARAPAARTAAERVVMS